MGILTYTKKDIMRTLDKLLRDEDTYMLTWGHTRSKILITKKGKGEIDGILQ